MIESNSWKGVIRLIPLKISDNIIELRHKKKVTQDELAAFLGVTKASVSKWETKQSYPDILLLPQIAAYFDVSIDELMGYEPQLSPEQIKKCYLDLAADFARLPFEEVMQKSKKLAKEYYSCYPFLIQIAVLWMNHMSLSKDESRQLEILGDIANLCDHICEDSSDIGICSDGTVLKAIANLQLGKAEEVIDTLQPLVDPIRLMNQTDSILIQAYQIAGDGSKAEYYSQVVTYLHLLNLVSNSIGMINMHMQDREFCDITIRRISAVIDTYDLENLHPNTTLQFHYQAAIFYCAYQQKEQALEELNHFVTGTLAFLKKGITLHGDTYFNRLDEWFDQFTLGIEAPRNDKVVFHSAVQALDNPALNLVFGSEEYLQLKNHLVRKGE